MNWVIYIALCVALVAGCVERWWAYRKKDKRVADWMEAQDRQRRAEGLDMEDAA